MNHKLGLGHILEANDNNWLIMRLFVSKHMGLSYPITFYIYSLYNVLIMCSKLSASSTLIKLLILNCHGIVTQCLIITMCYNVIRISYQ
jgi:hypothetical protein